MGSRQCVRSGVTTPDLLLSAAGIGRLGSVRFRNVQIRSIAFYGAASLQVLPAKIDLA
jgi:hypothetical protein